MPFVRLSTAEVAPAPPLATHSGTKHNTQNTVDIQASMSLVITKVQHLSISPTISFASERYCESNVIVPVIQKAAGNYDFVRSIEEGFQLTWQQPPEDAACASCEATSGFCGFRTGGIGDNTTSFLCICSDGQHLVKCHNGGMY
ncbi:hypothetical protein SLEP1_g52155 [Rubroshorea leprosula]|uniref:Wall-associated receptor kinase C-terminal domain-containing protein n=1 Tax=Rubroshorea leprosula TaxID=152421 RepID=A0AAV5M819_9ROSI|nr:hypothetical protein SLEP1_g52155 [Rubroshorea leprosula]